MGLKFNSVAKLRITAGKPVVLCKLDSGDVCTGDYRSLASECAMGYAKQSQWDFGSNETLPLLSCKLVFEIYSYMYTHTLTTKMRDDHENHRVV